MNVGVYLLYFGYYFFCERRNEGRGKNPNPGAKNSFLSCVWIWICIPVTSVVTPCSSKLMIDFWSVEFEGSQVNLK